MKIHPKDLDYLLNIVKYLYFKVKIGETIEISRLTTDNTAQLKACLNFIIQSGLCYLGGFSLYYTDSSKTAIKKTKHIKQIQDEKDEQSDYVLSFDFEKIDITDFKNIFRNGSGSTNENRS